MAVTSLGTYKKGEDPNDLLYVFLESDGTALDLTGYTVKGVATDPTGTDATTVVGSLEDAANGIVRVAWDATWTATVGPWSLVIWVGDGTVTLASATILYNITYATAPSLP